MVTVGGNAAAVEQRLVEGRLGGAGRARYDPDMLLTLLIYAYGLGQRSSRRIETLCVRDLGLKVVTGNRVVDHSTIAAFRADHQDAIKTLFAQVLLLCAKAGLVQVGVVAGRSGDHAKPLRPIRLLAPDTLSPPAGQRAAATPGGPAVRILGPETLDLFRHREEVRGTGAEIASPLQARDLRFDAVERRWTPLSDNLRVNLVRPRP